MSSYTFKGPDATTFIGMMSMAAQYLAGPGLDGFNEWLDGRTTGSCNCGHPEKHRENTGRHMADAHANLDRLYRQAMARETAGQAAADLLAQLRGDAGDPS